MNADNERFSRCERCKADLLGWGGFIEYYDPSKIRKRFYRVCPDCQTLIARAIDEIMGKEYEDD